MLVGNKEFSKITSLIMSAAMDPVQWSGVMEAIYQACGVKPHIFGHDQSINKCLGAVHGGYSPEAVEGFNSTYHAINPWVPRFMASQVGKPIYCEQMFPRRFLEKTQFYDEWLRPEEEIVGGGGVLLFREHDRMFAFGGNIRRKDIDRIEEEWIEFVDLISSHLHQAFEINRMIQSLTIEQQGLYGTDQSLSDQTQAAIFAIAKNRSIAYANPAAHLLLEAGDIVRASTLRCLNFVDGTGNRILDHAILKLYQSDYNKPIAFNIVSPVTKVGFVCRILNADPAFLSKSPFNIYTLVQEPFLLVSLAPRASLKSMDALLREMFGFTASEADIAQMIADGFANKDIADARNVSIHTVRNQVKAIMSKMRVSRMADIALTIEKIRNQRSASSTIG